MKLRVATVGLILALLTGSFDLAQAQSSVTKVTLKSGQVLEGTVLDELADGGVKLILVDGSTRTVAGADIASIARPGAAPASPPAPPPSAPPAEAPPAEAPPATQPDDPSSALRGGAGETCQARSDCEVGLRCIAKVCRDPNAPAVTETAAAGSLSGEEEEAQPSSSAEGFDGWYGGALVGGAVAPSFPGVAGVGGGTALFGWRTGMLDVRVGIGGFGAAFPNGSMGVATVRPEVLLFVAGPYGFGAGLGPCVGYYDDGYISGVISGGLASVTPVALRFEAGAAVLEPSLAAGAIFGSVEGKTGVLARPFGLLGFAVYSK